jgi:hypothetical protein
MIIINLFSHVFFSSQQCLILDFVIVGQGLRGFLSFILELSLKKIKKKTENDRENKNIDKSMSIQKKEKERTA